MGHLPKRRRYMINMDDHDEEDSGIVSAQSGGKGGGGSNNIGSNHESIEPEKKLMRSNNNNVVSFHHFYRNWFEIDTGLFCVPSQHSIHNMMTREMQKLLKKFKENGLFVYVNVRVDPLKLSNFIVLSDNIKLEGGGVTEVSSFVQNSKLIHIKVKQPNIGSTYAMYVKQINDENNRLYIPVEDLKTSQTQNATNLISKMKFGKGNDDYDLEDIGIYGFKDQQIHSMNRINLRGSSNKAGIFDLDIAIKGGQNHDELHTYPSSQLIGFNIQNQLKDYDLSIIDAVDCVSTCPAHYPPCLWSATIGDHSVRADDILTKDQLPPYTIGWTGGAPDPTPVYGEAVWQPAVKNYGAFIKEDAGDHIHARKRLAGRVNNSRCHDYFTMIPIHTSEGKRMKLRASVMIETSIHVDFLFRTRGLTETMDITDLEEFNDWIEIVGHGTHHEAGPNMKGIMKDIGMFHFNF